ncbi:Dyp-type peroxidase [Sphingomonas sp. RB3P16]|uniref:Dyp-type peroxidase n=1 Tax=Parasphingomonas frigoris TaxID=3096163 RepID=UPI002FCBDA34
MTTTLDLADIQGGILRAYGRQGFPKARYFFLTIRDAARGRAFVEALRPKICTAARWKNPARGEPLQRTRNPRVKDIVRAEGVPDYPGEVQLMKPTVAINIAFTFYGLAALEVPTRTLRAMPDAFIDGMATRASILGDDPFLERRDAVWRQSQGATRVHLLVSMNAEMKPDGTPTDDLERETAMLQQLCADSHGGVVLLPGTGPDEALWQDMSAVMHDDPDGPKPSNKEHFGLSDGFGDPVFEGQLSPEAERLRVIGGGKLLPDRSWAPIATGEFLLGYPDEAQEIPDAAMPIEFSRNGTFMAYRKLHEDVAAFDAMIAEQGRGYAAQFGVPQDEAEDTVKAKLVGRWRDGVPLMAAPTYAAWRAFNAELTAAHQADDKPRLAQLALKFTDFTYRPDPAGSICPATSHLRRANPRDMLDPHFGSSDPGDGSALVNRRRILRRGLPYGRYDRAAPADHGDHGIIFLAICADLTRQFEFVQQQWMQYGLDFNAGSDTCPIIGNHPPEHDPKLVIIADAKAKGARPFVCQPLPQLVEPRGGDYFFIPSMTALRLIGMGIVDPT